MVIGYRQLRISLHTMMITSVCLVIFVVWVHTKASRKALDYITVALVALHSSCVQCKYYINIEHVTGYWPELIHLVLVCSADIKLYCNHTLYLLLVAYTTAVCLTGMTVPLPLPILKLCQQCF